MKLSNKLKFTPKALTFLALTTTLMGHSVNSVAEKKIEYNFMTGTDVYDALDADAQIIRGYVLGITDALKHSKIDKECFTIPYHSKADIEIFNGYLDYWYLKEIPESSVEAISEMMIAKFPCQ